MKQNKRPEEYQKTTYKSRPSNLTIGQVAEIAGEIQKARFILDGLSLDKLAKKAGTSKQNLQQQINRRNKQQKGGGK